MKMKKLLFVPLLVMGLLSSMTACSKRGGITIWSLSDELIDITDMYYSKPANVIPKGVTEIKSNLSNAIRSGKGIPDVIALEAAVIADFTCKTSEEADLLPLDDIGGTEQMYDYTKAVATSTDGKILGLSWQATPGGFFYKKSIANKLGITSVEQMEQQISTWEGYLELAETCKKFDLDTKKEGVQSIAVCSAITDPVKVFLSGREKPWVVNNVLQLEDIMFGGGSNPYNCFDVVRELQQKGYTHESTDRGRGWVADIDSNNTLGYFCSSWGLNFDLMPNAKSSFGDWQMCKAPIDYFKGGTWLAIPKGASHVEEAKEFIKFITTDKEFLKARGKEAGDFMNNKEVMRELVANYSCDFLGGQNHLAKLYEVAEKINGELISPYDAVIDQVFTTTVANYARDKADTPEDLETAREEQIGLFITGVRSRYISIIVEE